MLVIDTISTLFKATTTTKDTTSVLRVTCLTSLFNVSPNTRLDSCAVYELYTDQDSDIGIIPPLAYFGNGGKRPIISMINPTLLQSMI